MITQKTTLFSILIICFIAFFFIYITPTHALELNIKNYPKIPAPVRDFDLDCISGVGRGEDCDGPPLPLTVGNIILFIFVTAIWIGSIIAFVVLVYTGFTFIFSGESPGIRYKAKERLTNVIWGMLILLLSTVSLRLINPDITDLKEPGLKSVEAGKGWKLTLPGLKVKGKIGSSSPASSVGENIQLGLQMAANRGWVATEGLCLVFLWT